MGDNDKPRSRYKKSFVMQILDLLCPRVENSHTCFLSLTAALLVGCIVAVLHAVAAMFGEDALAGGGAGPAVAGAVERRAVPFVALVVTVLAAVAQSSLRDAALVVALEVAGRAHVFVCSSSRVRHLLQCFLTPWSI